MKQWRWLLLLCGMPSLVFAQFDQGVHYQALHIKADSAPLEVLHTERPSKVYLIEFFSYGCHWCHDLEPHLQKWIKTQPKNVEVVRVPVVFHPSWRLLAKAYFIAEALDVSKKMDPYLFQYLYEHKGVVDGEGALRTLFIGQGVKAEDFDRVSESKAVFEKLRWAESMVQLYQVRMVPTLVVHSESINYMTNTQMGGAFDNLLRGVSDLIKEHNAPTAP